VPILRAANPDDPNIRAGPANGRGFAVRTSANDLDGASVWMLKWCAPAEATRRFGAVSM
jgi:hypothetical protein